MKRTEENQYSMMRTVQTVFRNHEADVEAVPALEAAVTKLDGILTDLSIAMQAQQDGAQGETATKAAQKQTLIDVALGIKGAVKALANNTNDAPLLDRVDYSPSGFSRLRDTALAEAAQSIHDAAFEHKGPLADYGIAAAHITVLANAIESYRSVLTAPRVAVAEQKAQVQRITTLVAQANDVLRNTIDNVMLQFKIEKPAFFTTYTAARVIVDTGIRHTTVRGKVTDAATGEPIYGATVTIVELNRNATTSTDGVYGVQRFEGGVYTVTADHKDYRSQTHNTVEVPRGRGLELHFTLTKS